MIPKIPSETFNNKYRNSLTLDYWCLINDASSYIVGKLVFSIAFWARIDFGTIDNNYPVGTVGQMWEDASNY